MKFQDMIIDSDIEKALEKLHWQKPTPIQERVIPLLKAKRNAVIQAKTGSGKTGAYLLPILDHITWAENKPQCLILAPTRELAMQIKEESEQLGKYKRIKSVALVGKQPMAFQIQDLKQKTHIVTGTPGRVLEHLMQGSLCVDHLSYVILDEADEMCRMGFMETIEQILSYMPEQITYCMCSATISENVMRLCDTCFPAYETVLLEEAAVSKQLSCDAYEIAAGEKDDFLWKLLLVEACSGAIVFCNTRAICEHVYHELKKHMQEVECLHGAMEQKEREKAWERFRYGEAQILVASDIAARGLDVEQVDTIIHYELPQEKERFIHRCGRSGRMEAQGHVISLITKKDHAQKEAIETFCHVQMQMQDVESIRAYAVDAQAVEHFIRQRKVKAHKGKVFQDDVLRLYIHGGKKKKIRAGDLVGAICRIEGIQGDDIGVIQIQDYGCYVEILHGKGPYVYRHLQTTPIKNRIRKVEISHHQ